MTNTKRNDNIKLTDIVYETKNFWVAKVNNGFEVYNSGITHSVRVAIIGYRDDIGLERAKIECNKRQDTYND